MKWFYMYIIAGFCIYIYIYAQPSYSVYIYCLCFFAMFPLSCKCVRACTVCETSTHKITCSVQKCSFQKWHWHFHWHIYIKSLELEPSPSACYQYTELAAPADIVSLHNLNNLQLIVS